MIRIKCVNPNCTAPEGKFLWDERAHVEGSEGVAEPGDPDAVAFIVECPHCGHENKIYLKLPNKEELVKRVFKRTGL